MDIVGVRYIKNIIINESIAEIIGFLHCDDMKIHIEISVHPSIKKPINVPMQVAKDILPKKQSVIGIIVASIQLINKTVIEARYFPRTISISLNGSEKSNLSVFCLYSSEKLFIVKIGIVIRNKKARL